jgi:THUMP domain-like/Conserved hypothetical protein 95
LDNSILKPEIQDFISKNINVDVSKLALQKNPFPDSNWINILNQISGRTKAKIKLPTFFETKNIIFPSKISVEQTSSEITAFYKQKIVFGENLIDLTGGFGVDSFIFSKKINNVVHCEINFELSEIVRHNFKQLQSENIQVIQGDSFKILKDLNKKFDWIYVDPSRRNDAKGKVFMLKDCLPNVPENLDFYFQFTNNILIKTAPLLDISAGLLELKNVKTIHIIAIENEVKELLWEIENNYFDTISIKTINSSKNELHNFNFELKSNKNFSMFSLPKKYLYEPNAAVMKSGGFDEISTQFDVYKLHQNSHLYTSDLKIKFPGRIFEIEKIIAYNKTEIKRSLENSKTNITIRNFPETVDEIRKKWKIKEGGTTYSFFTTNCNDQKNVLICTKI